MSSVIDDVKAELAAMGWSNLDTLGGATKADGTKAGSPAWSADIETACERIEARRALAELGRRSALSRRCESGHLIGAGACATCGATDNERCRLRVQWEQREADRANDEGAA